MQYSVFHRCKSIFFFLFFLINFSLTSHATVTKVAPIFKQVNQVSSTVQKRKLDPFLKISERQIRKIKEIRDCKDLKLCFADIIECNNNELCVLDNLIRGAEYDFELKNLKLYTKMLKQRPWLIPVFGAALQSRISYKTNPHEIKYWFENIRKNPRGLLYYHSLSKINTSNTNTQTSNKKVQ